MIISERGCAVSQLCRNQRRSRTRYRIGRQVYGVRRREVRAGYQRGVAGIRQCPTMMLKDRGDECSHSLQVHTGPASKAIDPSHQLKSCAQGATRDFDRLHLSERKGDPIRIDCHCVVVILCIYAGNLCHLCHVKLLTFVQSTMIMLRCS